MGSLSDNGGSWPPDGGAPDGLPDLPPEWGDIVVPDDLSSLADEVEAIRAELRRQDPRTGWQRLTGRAGVRRLRRLGAAAVRAPVLIVSMAVLVTLASIFASAWPGPARLPSSQRSAGDGRANGAATRLPALELVDANGVPVPLVSELPVVILLVDGCDCARLVADVAMAARAETTVVTVRSGIARTGTTPPGGPATQTGATPQTGAAPQTGATPQTGAAAPAGGKVVQELRDPAEQLRSDFRLAGPDGTAAALLIDRTGAVVQRVPRTLSIDDFRANLNVL